MLTSISPVGEAARQQRWWLTVTAFTAGALSGGALVGATAGLIGAVVLPAAVPAGAALAALTLLGCLGILLDRGHVALRVVSWRRQVDERWLTTYRGWVYGAGFGLQLGLGFATIVPSAVSYVAFAAIAATGDPRSGALIGAGFGLARAVPVVGAGRWRDPVALRAGMAAFAARERTVAATTTALQAVVPAALLLAVAA